MVKPRYPNRRSPLADWWKILAMGVLLAGLVYVTFVHEPASTAQLGSGPPVARVEVAVPEIDQELLRTARDSTHEERLVLEPEPLAHLLEASMDVVPTVAEALGMPREPIPISVLRATPGTYRGAYLWYRGELKAIAAKSGHPVDGFRIHEGWIETPDGDTVMFRVSRPADVEVGDFVRVEGFFLKLRDSAAAPRAEQAPLLVGPQVFREHRPWAPVEELDPAMFEGIRDGIVEGGEVVDFEDSRLDLEESEGPPLWALASYARHRAAGADHTLGRWRTVPAFVTKEQLDQARFGQVEPGTPFRVLGTFVMGRWFAARPNPAGIEYWTKAWIQVRDLGGKLVPVWIPRKVDDVRHNDPLEVRAYYFRRYWYDIEHEVREGDRSTTVEGLAFTPVFVAADLDRFEVGPEHGMVTWFKWGFAALVIGLIGLFTVLARRESRARGMHEQQMIERRRRRRGRGAPSAPQAGT